MVIFHELNQLNLSTLIQHDDHQHNILKYKSNIKKRKLKQDM